MLGEAEKRRARSRDIRQKARHWPVNPIGFDRGPRVTTVTPRNPLETSTNPEDSHDKSAIDQRQKTARSEASVWLERVSMTENGPRVAGGATRGRAVESAR